jgi:hypothetical protein
MKSKNWRTDFEGKNSELFSNPTDVLESVKLCLLFFGICVYFSQFICKASTVKALNFTVKAYKKVKRMKV